MICFHDLVIAMKVSPRSRLHLEMDSNTFFAILKREKVLLQTIFMYLEAGSLSQGGDICQYIKLSLYEVCSLNKSPMSYILV